MQRREFLRNLRDGIAGVAIGGPAVLTIISSNSGTTTITQSYEEYCIEQYGHPCTTTLPPEYFKDPNFAEWYDNVKRGGISFDRQNQNDRQ